MAQTGVILALTTEADAQRAETLARKLLERRLVACVALSPLTSLYHWQGALTRSDEVQLLIKTSADRLEALQAAIRQLHSYDTPEWLHWSAQASAPYGLWLEQNCRGELRAATPDGTPPADADPPAGADPAG